VSSAVGSHLVQLESCSEIGKSQQGHEAVNAEFELQKQNKNIYYVL
jgi:hypothetical protein